MGFCVLLLLISISVSLLSVGASDGIIVPGKSISVNQSIISASENFALGFFSLGNSTPRYYLGLWYNKVQKKSVVVWVANRESRTDSLGTVDEFLNFENVKLPDHSYLLRNMSAKDCESRYLNNCSCTAYPYVNASEETSGICLNWHRDLVDLLKEFVAPDLYVRIIMTENLLEMIEVAINLHVKTMDIIFEVAAVSVGLLSVLFGNFIWRKNYGKQGASL